ncbi:MAG: riboflavin synthase [Sphingobacteriales bacterium]|nr:MAG: riboflavin synthase [Sphingobacteriales bacterium]
MFTGIIETLGSVIKVDKNQSNIDFTIESSISNQLKIDQSVAHNGVCLTVTKVEGNTHTVTAIDETLAKTNLGDWKVSTLVNLERCMQLNGRLDGHIVQGHVDQTAICLSVTETQGSWFYTFEYQSNFNHITVEKGSITINGISLTVVNSQNNQFSVAIIPYTFENTNLKTVQVGSKVNLEFDIIGKYIAKLVGLKG